MSKSDTLKAMLAANAFDKLTPFKEPAEWEAMTHDERELLGILFVKQGEHQLQQGDSKVLESFELASKVAPHSPTIFYRQALIYASQGENIRCLKAADEALKKSVELDPSFVSAWHCWGNILLRIGYFYENMDHFIEADEKFAKAESLSKASKQRYTDSLYWHWGVCLYNLGKYSGEAVDFHRALEKFRLAEHEIDAPEFHFDFGHALADLATLIGRQELLLEAIDQYEKGTNLSPMSHEGWLCLACAYQRLFNFASSRKHFLKLNLWREYFAKSDECFENAAEKNFDDPIIWMKWGELHLAAGRVARDPDQLTLAIEKFKNADFLETDNPYIMVRWGEALMLSASINESLEMLREAESKIVAALKPLAKECEAWYLYGLLMCEFGRYFACKDYYLKATEKFECGLQFKDAYPPLLQGMAMAYFSAGELSGDVKLVEKAIGCYARAAELCERVSAQFLSDWGVAQMKLGEMTNDPSHVEQAAAKFETAILDKMESSGRLDSFEGDDLELEWLYNYGCALDFLGDFNDEPVYYEKSVRALSHVLKLDPDYIHARYNLALALSHLGEINADADCFHQATEQFQMVIEHDPEDEMAWNDYALAFLHLGLLLNDPLHKENTRYYFDQAEHRLFHSISLGNIHAYYNLACLYALTERPVEAIYFLQKAEQADALPPADDVIHDEWLDALRDQPEYRLLIARQLNKQAMDDYDDLQDLPF